MRIQIARARARQGDIILQSLPPLPEELQYRIIGQSLVLWDCHANLIVDFLPGAFVPTT